MADRFSPDPMTAFINEVKSKLSSEEHIKEYDQVLRERSRRAVDGTTTPPYYRDFSSSREGEDSNSACPPGPFSTVAEAHASKEKWLGHERDRIRVQKAKEEQIRQHLQARSLMRQRRKLR